MLSTAMWITLCMIAYCPFTGECHASNLYGYLRTWHSPKPVCSHLSLTASVHTQGTLLSLLSKQHIPVVMPALLGHKTCYMA